MVNILIILLFIMVGASTTMCAKDWMRNPYDGFLAALFGIHATVFTITGYFLIYEGIKLL